MKIIILIPTAEVPVTKHLQRRLFKRKCIPNKETAYTPVSEEKRIVGKDVRGIKQVAINLIKVRRLYKSKHPDNHTKA